jgi:hypothetical protein
LDASQLIIGIVFSAAVIAILVAVGWCLFDVVIRARDVSLPQRVVWVVALLTVNVIAAILYIRIGPGGERWGALR